MRVKIYIFKGCGFIARHKSLASPEYFSWARSSDLAYPKYQYILGVEIFVKILAHEFSKLALFLLSFSSM
jgi:hypothetical protein